MTRFQDGPAQGQTLMLIRSPIFLRITERKEDGVTKWDALNIPDDKPMVTETIHAYILVAHNGNVHINADRGRGFYPSVTYAHIRDQPSDAIKRDTVAWARWVDQAATLKQYAAQSQLLKKLQEPTPP